MEQAGDNMKIFYNKHGSLTIFMSLILTVVIIFTTVLVDGGRIILAGNIVSGAGDMALNAGLTYYNSVLQDTYGLFAISKDMNELRKNLEVYFDATLKSNGLHDHCRCSKLHIIKHLCPKHICIGKICSCRLTYLKTFVSQLHLHNI